MDRANDMEATDFDAVSWVEAKGWVTMGQLGGQWAEVTSDQIGEEETIYDKGAHSKPLMENVFDRIADDPGQLKLIEAKGSRSTYPIRLVYNDAPSAGAAPTPSERMFVGLVMSDTRSGGGANDPRRMTVSTRPVSNYVDVAAATGD